MHWFPTCWVAWNTRNLFLHVFGGWWSEIKVLADPCSLEDYRGGYLPCFSLSFWCCQQSLVFPGLSMHWHLTLVSASVVSWCSPFVSPCLFSSYKDTSYTELGSILMNSFYLTISANTLFPNKVTLNRYYGIEPQHVLGEHSQPLTHSRVERAMNLLQKTWFHLFCHLLTSRVWTSSCKFEYYLSLERRKENLPTRLVGPFM